MGITHRWKDGPDTFLVGKPKAHAAPLKGITLTSTPDDFRMREMFLIHTRPELYDEWHRDLMDDWFNAEAERLDAYGWDCHTCRRAVFTHELHDRCPNCAGTGHNTAKAA